MLWLKERIVSVSLSGFINYVCPETMAVTKVLKGHNKSITAMALSEDRLTAFTADFEGHISEFRNFPLIRFFAPAFLKYLGYF